MNSKDRILAAIRLEQPDRTPIDLLPNRWVEERLRRDLGARTHRDLLQRLNCDVVDLRGVVDPRYRGPVPFCRELAGGVRENIWGWRQKVVQTATGPEEQFVEFALGAATSAEDIDRRLWPNPDWFDFSDFAERLEPWKHLAVMATGASVFQHPTFLRGIDKLLMDMAGEPEMANLIMDKFTDFYIGYFDRMLTAAAGRIDILRIADDLGTQQGLFVSPAMFRTFFKPRIQRLVDMAHSHGVKLMFHSCGAILPLIEDLIEIGVDILDPLQAAAAGMDPKVLKERFGSRICLHGGICTQYLLPSAAPGEIHDEVQRRMQILGKDGGYILAPCHVLQTDVPTENILAFVEAGLGKPIGAGRLKTNTEATGVSET